MYILIFRLSIFGDFKRFTPSTTNVIGWTQALQDAGYDFLPSIFQPPVPIAIPFQPVQISSNDKRMQFVSPDGEFTIRILSERIDVELTQGTADTSEEYLYNKIDDALKIMETITKVLGDIHGNRLAYYTDIFIPETSERPFNNFYQKNNIEISIENPIQEFPEWSHRFNQRIEICFDEKKEKSNAIFLVESKMLQTFNATTGEQQSVKGLHISSDINTLAEDVSERFISTSLNGFSHEAQSVFLKVLKQIQANLNK